MLDKNDASYVSFINHDNALVVDFLTSAAGVLSDRSIISLKDIDNLRLVMSNAQSQDGIEKQSTLLSLKDQNADFVETLNCLFGEFGFGINLLRHTVKNYLTPLSDTACSFGHELLLKSQSLFNRSFLVYVNDSCHYQVLFSSALVDLAQVFSDATQSMRQIQERCSVMIATGLEQRSSASLEGIDRALAQALGFQQSTRICLPLTIERGMLLDISALLIEVADGCEVFLNSLRKNIRKTVAPQLDFLCEELRLEAGKLRETRFFRGDDLSTWEVRRLSIAMALAKFTDLIKVFEKCLVSAISLDSAPLRQPSDDLHRLIGIHLIATGVSPRDAKVAATKLTAYCELHRIEPAQLLVAELSKIDKNLNEESLEILRKRYGDSSLNLASSEEKSRNIQQTQSLMKTFLRETRAGVTTALLAFGVSSLFACGFKTNPKSEVVDPRPDLPFRLSEGVQLPKTPAKPVEDISK